MSSDLRHDINMVIREVAAFFTAALLLASVCATYYTGESASEVLASFKTILTSPSPLVTDYFGVGSLPAALLNAGLCGLICTLFMLLPGAVYRPNVWGGFFLVIAHCFYGLNLINMWPPILGFLFYCRFYKHRFRDNLDKAMFITSFAPFFSELLFRYPMPYKVQFTIFGISFHIIRLEMCAILAVFVGVLIPAMLTGTSKLHRGFNLYNGGLATGLLGMFIYAFMFKTMGVTPKGSVEFENSIYNAHENSYIVFATVFFIFLASVCILVGWIRNGKTFKGYGKLLQHSGYKANFLHDFGLGLVWINLGCYLLLMLVYMDAVILLTDGAGFTGPTFGVILAAMTFAASGQHPKNVWPILLGYVLCSAFVHAECFISTREVPWTLSTQGYMNGVAFATGLCPFAGEFGWQVGAIAGFISAVLCTTSGAMHGGFVLYNGGLTAGISALILIALIDHHLSFQNKK